MKEMCICELRRYMSRCLYNDRTTRRFTQEQFSCTLMMDRRSYVDLEHGKTFCCAFTLIVYLTHCCADPVAYLRDCKILLDRITEGAESASTPESSEPRRA